MHGKAAPRQRRCQRNRPVTESGGKVVNNAEFNTESQYRAQFACRATVTLKPEPCVEPRSSRRVRGIRLGNKRIAETQKARRTFLSGGPFRCFSGRNNSACAKGDLNPHALTGTSTSS